MTMQPLDDRAFRPQLAETEKSESARTSRTPATMTARWRASITRFVARQRLSPMPVNAPDGLAEPEWDREIRRELIRITARRIF